VTVEFDAILPALKYRLLWLDWLFDPPVPGWGLPPLGPWGPEDGGIPAPGGMGRLRFAGGRFPLPTLLDAILLLVMVHLLTRTGVRDKPSPLPWLGQTAAGLAYVRPENVFALLQCACAL